MSEIVPYTPRVPSSLPPSSGHNDGGTGTPTNAGTTSGKAAQQRQHPESPAAETLQTEQEKLIAIFRKVDTSADDSLSPGEFVRALRREDIAEELRELLGLSEGFRVRGESNGTRDLCGDAGLTTEEFVDHIAAQLSGSSNIDDIAKKHAHQKQTIEREGSFEPNPDASTVDNEAMRMLFDSLDLDGNGNIDFDEFTRGITKLGVAPRKHLNKFN